MSGIPKTELVDAKCQECNKITEHTLHDWPGEKVYQCQKCGKAFSIKKK